MKIKFNKMKAKAVKKIIQVQGPLEQKDLI